MARMPLKTRYRTRDELARALGMTVRNLAYYLAAGMPGAPDAYCLEDAENWLLDRARRQREELQERRRDRRLARRR